jgi:YegS/Rv2252/BmrU family lipid kinase
MLLYPPVLVTVAKSHWIRAKLSDRFSITVLINPAAGSGTGAQVRPLVEQTVPQIFAGSDINFIETRSREDALEIAATCSSNMIICVGGDGSLHDVAQLIMQRPIEQRPIISIIPVGSGNDYARTLGVSMNPGKALGQLDHGKVVLADVGQVNDIYFLETMSLGVDAAVAIYTEQLRLNTKTKGIRLYARAAVSAIMRDLKAHKVHYVFDGREYNNKLLILAIQNGPTYGSGFKMAPRASVTDGQLDVYTAFNIGKIRALYYLSQIKNGKHERLEGFANYQARKIQLELEEQIPIQCDGEQLFGTSFQIELLPAALPVYVPSDSPVLS